MNKTCLFLLLFVFLLLMGFYSFPVYSISSPHLEISPNSGGISSAGTEININIDTGGLEAKSAKAVINFGATKLEVDSIEAGDFFDEVSHNIYNDHVVVNANLSLGSSLESKTGTGTLATMTVKAVGSSGTAAMTFDCTEGSSTDSGINDPTPIDIIDCSANIDGSYDLNSQSSSSSSPSPTSSLVSPSPISVAVGGLSSSPSALPVSGTPGPTISLIFLGIGLILISLPIFTLIF